MGDDRQDLIFLATDALGVLRPLALTRRACLSVTQRLAHAQLEELLVLDPAGDHDFEQELVGVARGQDLLAGRFAVEYLIKRLTVEADDVLRPEAAFDERLAQQRRPIQRAFAAVAAVFRQRVGVGVSGDGRFGGLWLR